ncbi:MAG: exodeoxyribonuclease VII small subunit [Desulfotignum sp.]|jgi:exodeoxyribonuclease VII small subunit|nr:exodeoxyribonuclease VII small subunit [Desulfotignum sp.]
MAKITFETALKQLEAIVKEMESGDLTLEQAVKKYETGIEKVRYCMQILDSTEKKISQLTRDLDGSVTEIPFDHE